MAFRSTKLISLLTILTLAISGSAFADTVKIGSLSAVTGPIAKLVPPIINGSKLAIKQINASGGILNGKKLELIVGDTGCNAQASVDAATKLVNVEQVVAIVGALCSGATIGAANNVAIPSNVVMVSTSAVLFSRHFRHQFRTLLEILLAVLPEVDSSMESGGVVVLMVRGEL